jgi:hypothetical protein
MSLTRKNTADLNTGSTVRAAKLARDASSAAAANAANAAQNATLAAQNAAGVAQTAAQNAAVAATSGLSRGVRQGVYTARSWAAPRLDGAADYCTTTVAPKVSAALRTTARQVSPADTVSSKRSSTLTWSLLGAAVLAALGATAALVRYRYRAAIAADCEAEDVEIVVESPDSQAAPASPDGAQPPAARPTDQGTETSVNGRVTSSGW